MARTIGVLSGKGGVGKTTLVSNLGVALSKIGKKVLLVDADLSGANLVQHFGIEPTTNLNDVLAGRAFITEAFYKLEGVGIIPSSILDFEGNLEKLKDILLDFTGYKDIILIDGPSGCGRGAENIIQASDEIIIVTEPEIPALTNAIGILKLAENYNRPITGIIINKLRGEKSELKSRQIEETLNRELLGTIPNHRKVREAIAMREPIIRYYPRSKVSKEVLSIAYRVLGVRKPKETFRDRIRNFLFSLK